MKTLEIKVKNDAGEQVKVHLRLTAGSQIQLKEKYNEETMSFLLAAVTDIEKTISLFDMALNYRNNDNTILEGEELYDCLVDMGKAGTTDFGKIITDIGVNSGIITKPQANTIMNSMEKTINGVFEDLEETMTADETEEGETPTAEASND